MISSGMISFFGMIATSFFAGYLIGWFTLLRINKASNKLDGVNSYLTEITSSNEQLYRDFLQLASRVDYLEKALLSAVRKNS